MVDGLRGQVGPLVQKRVASTVNEKEQEAVQTLHPRSPVHSVLEKTIEQRSCNVKDCPSKLSIRAKYLCY